MKLLLDTNILIPLERSGAPDAGNTLSAYQLSRIAHESGHSFYVHPDVRADVARDRDLDRSQRFRSSIAKYAHLPDPPPITARLTAILGSPPIGSNDWVDNRLLAALVANSVHLLVSEDAGILAKARKLGVADRVLRLAEAISLLGRPVIAAPPAVRKVAAHDLDPVDPIFQSFREDYPEFDEWFTRCRLEHRETWRIDGPAQAIAGFCIVKDEDEAIPLLGKRPTKICSFKVAPEYIGHKYGELLLKAVFDRCAAAGRTGLFVTVFAKHAGLIELLLDFGFEQRTKQTPRGEEWLGKQLEPGADALSGLQYHLRHGPPRFDPNVNWHIVPIRPEYADALFPESAVAPPLFAGQHAFGNAIRKAYLCNSPSRQVAVGDIVAFYRTQRVQGLISLGVVEDVLVSQNAADIAMAVARRSVYSFTEIEQLCTRPVLALLFRQAVVVRPARAPHQLVDARVFKRAPQSILTVAFDGLEWLRAQFRV